MHQADISSPAKRVLGEILRHQAEYVGDAEFLVDETRRLSFSAADDLGDRHANAYRELGVGQGDTVALLMHNSADMGVTSFGVNRAGGIWSPASTEYRGEWLGHLLTSSRANVLVVDDDLWPSVSALPEIPFQHIVVRGSSDAVRQEALKGVTVHDFATFDQYDPRRFEIDARYSDTNAVLWTSGTTGPSKGVMQSHNAWVAACQGQNESWRNVRDGDRFYCCLPMYNSGGWLMNIYPALLSGVAACIDERFSASNFWQQIRRHGATHSIVLGTMITYLLEQPPQPDDADNPLRTLVMVPALPQLMQPFMQRFGIETVGSGLGQSEAMGVTLYCSDWPLKPGSCGYVHADTQVEVKLLDDDDREVPVGEVGELCARASEPYRLYNGYFGEPERTLEAWRNQWHHTGDLARVDEDGELFFVDRKKDSLRHGGRNLSTFEVEHIAAKFPGIQHVAAVGVKLKEMDDKEEELMICIVPSDGVSIDPLEFCKFMDANAPYFFVPRYVQLLDEMPLTPTSKIQKYKLRQKGVDETTWDRLREASDWKPTR